MGQAVPPSPWQEENGGEKTPHLEQGSGGKKHHGEHDEVAGEWKTTQAEISGRPVKRENSLGGDNLQKRTFGGCNERNVMPGNEKRFKN